MARETYRLMPGEADTLSLVLAAHHQDKVEVSGATVDRNVVLGPTWEMRLERPPMSADYGMLDCAPGQRRPAMLWLTDAYTRLCEYVRANREPEPPPPTYHALHITTETIARTSIFDLPFGVQVICTRAGGWEVWHSERPPEAPTLIAAEYPAHPVSGLRLDVAGHVIVDSLTPEDAAANARP